MFSEFDLAICTKSGKGFCQGRIYPLDERYDYLRLKAVIAWNKRADGV